MSEGFFHKRRSVKGPVPVYLDTNSNTVSGFPVSCEKESGIGLHGRSVSFIYDLGCGRSKDFDLLTDE